MKVEQNKNIVCRIYQGIMKLLWNYNIQCILENLEFTDRKWIIKCYSYKQMLKEPIYDLDLLLNKLINHSTYLHAWLLHMLLFAIFIDF